MASPELVHRPSTRGIGAVWGAALVMGIAVAIWAPDARLMMWMLLALSGSFVLAFAIQLWGGQADGFIQRVALSVVGALVILGVTSLIVGLVRLADAAAG